MIGRAEAPAFLADKPVGWLWGVGGAMQRRLAADGITRIGQLAALGERELGRALWPARRASGAPRARRGRPLPSSTHAPARSISAETTFARDESDREALARDAVAAVRAGRGCGSKQAALAAGTVTLKLKTGRFPPAHPLAPARRPDPACRYAVPHCAPCCSRPRPTAPPGSA